MRRFRFRISGASWPGARALAIGALLGAATLASQPASAQWFGPGGPWGAPRPYGMRPAPLPPGVIYAGLQRRGLRPLGRPRFTGAEYVVDAVNPRGDQVRLVIDAFDGEILDRTQVTAALIPPRNIGPGVYPGPAPYAPPEMAPREAAPRRKTARVEPSRGPKPSKALPASRAPNEGAPAVSPAAPPPVVQTEAPAPAAPAPAVTASVPAPAVEPAPARAPEPRAAATPEPTRSAEAPATEPAPAAPKSVRVIQGVTAVPGAGEPAKPGTWTEPPSAAPAQ